MYSPLNDSDPPNSEDYVEPKPVLTPLRTVMPGTMKGIYNGDELKPYEGRPGAMDAFDKPSKMGSRLHYRDGRVESAE